MPLSMFKTGETVRVVGIGGSDATKRHLGNLGFSAGMVVKVVGETPGGLIVGIQDSRLALDAELAKRIKCEAI